MGRQEHKKNAPKKLNVGIITISTTRTLSEDKSGRWMLKRAKKEGHNVVIHRVVGDNKELINLVNNSSRIDLDLGFLSFNPINPLITSDKRLINYEEKEGITEKPGNYLP